MLGHISIHLDVGMPVVLNEFLALFQGVPVFFILSGFLIWMSIGRTPDFKTYFKKRVLRLYPELWLCVVLELLSLITIYGEPVPLKDYVMFGFTQSTLFQFWTPDSMRGYGYGCPNGALWTITVIVQFYLFLWLVRKPLNKFSHISWIVLISLFVLFSLFTSSFGRASTAMKLYNATVLPYLWVFLLGAYVSRFHDRMIPMLKKYWILWLAALAFFVYTKFDIKASYSVLKCVALCAFIIGFAYRFPQFAVKRDISYGIYIYHMVLCNAAIELGYKGSTAAMLAVVAGTIVVSMLSYHYEKFVNRKFMVVRRINSTRL